MTFKQRLIADETGAAMAEVGLACLVLLTILKVCITAL